jgi:hypothetical protein
MEDKNKKIQEEKIKDLQNYINGVKEIYGPGADIGFSSFARGLGVNFTIDKTTNTPMVEYRPKGDKGLYIDGELVKNTDVLKGYLKVIYDVSKQANP